MRIRSSTEVVASSLSALTILRASFCFTAVPPVQYRCFQYL
jgi:hypothetical protein